MSTPLGVPPAAAALPAVGDRSLGAGEICEPFDGCVKCTFCCCGITGFGTECSTPADIFVRKTNKFLFVFLAVKWPKGEKERGRVCVFPPKNPLRRPLRRRNPHAGFLPKSGKISKIRHPHAGFEGALRGSQHPFDAGSQKSQGPFGVGWQPLYFRSFDALNRGIASRSHLAALLGRLQLPDSWPARGIPSSRGVETCEGRERWPPRLLCY